MFSRPMFRIHIILIHVLQIHVPIAHQVLLIHVPMPSVQDPHSPCPMLPWSMFSWPMFSLSMFSCSMFLIHVLYSHVSYLLGRYFLVTCFSWFTFSFPRSLVYAVNPSSPGPHLLIHVCPPGHPCLSVPSGPSFLVYISLISVLSYPYASDPQFHVPGCFHNSCMLFSEYKFL